MRAPEFRRLLHNGHGRAILYARRRSVKRFRKIILHACLHCHADPDLEGTRASFMLDLLEGLPDREFYIDAVLASLSEPNDDVHTFQRFRFAADLASAGHPTAKRRMYECFAPGPRYGESIATDFVDLDGLAGFLFAAAKIGALLESEIAGQVDTGWLLSRGRHELGEDLLDAALLEASKKDSRLAAFRNRAESDAVRFPRPKRPIEPSPSELESAAHEFLAATDSVNQRRLLRLFFKHRFPFDPLPLIVLAESPDRDVALSATRALMQVDHPAVRALAFRLVRSGSPVRMKAVAILDRNFSPGDHRTVLDWYAAEEDRNMLHSMDVKDFWKNHPGDATELEMLRARYEKEPCSFCRTHVVRRLIALGAFTEEMRAECAFDSSYETSELAAGR